MAPCDAPTNPMQGGGGRHRQGHPSSMGRRQRPGRDENREKEGRNHCRHRRPRADMVSSTAPPSSSTGEERGTQHRLLHRSGAGRSVLAPARSPRYQPRCPPLPDPRRRPRLPQLSCRLPPSLPPLNLPSVAPTAPSSRPPRRLVPRSSGRCLTTLLVITARAALPVAPLLLVLE